VTSQQHLAIRNWDRFQHYKERRPPWVKFHVDWLDDYELAELSPATRLLACQLLLVAAKQDNRIPNDPLWLAKRLTMTRLQVDKGLAELLAIRFVEPIRRKRRAITALSLARSREVEVEDKSLGLTETSYAANGQDFDLPELRGMA
jgi:hypothetical protein